MASFYPTSTPVSAGVDIPRVPDVAAQNTKNKQLPQLLKPLEHFVFMELSSN